MEKVGNGWGGGVNVSRGKDREEGGVVRSILWPASSSIPLNYCFILPLMRWDLFLQHSSLLWLSTCVYLHVCISICVIHLWLDQYFTIWILESAVPSLSFYVSFHPSVSSIFHFLSFSVSASAKYKPVTLLQKLTKSQMSTWVCACVCRVDVERRVKIHWLSLCTFTCS